MLPKTQQGIDVNVQFKGITAFEFTSELMLFDFCNTRLVHGWLVDPQDQETHTLISNLSYNQLVEKQIQFQTFTQAQAQAQTQGEGLANQLDALKIDENSSDSPVVVVDDAKNEIVRQGLLTEKFVNESASQLTYHGLSELHAGVNDEELCVFFRNNHFSTLYKHNKELLLLVTDQGYANEPLVWEKLCQIDGDSVFLTSDFIPYTPTSPPSIPREIVAEFAADQARIEQSDRDLALAMQMQQEEEDRNRAQTQAQPPAQAQAQAHQTRSRQPSNPEKRKKDSSCIVQ